MNFTLIISYNFSLYVTIGHYCPVPVDKHDSDKKFTLPPYLLGRVKG